jgi:hypothetical protein
MSNGEPQNRHFGTIKEKFLDQLGCHHPARFAGSHGNKVAAVNLR